MSAGSGGKQRVLDDYDYELVANYEMDYYYLDENKFSQLPWEDLQ